MSKYQKLNLDNIKTYPIEKRINKVLTKDFAKALKKNPSLKDLLNNLPDILSGKDFSQFIDDYKKAIRAKSQIILMMGAHLIKVGISPLIVDAMRNGWITHIAMNGACVIHDVEIAIWGGTSEDVAKGIQDGSFGMAQGSAKFINSAVSKAKDKRGYGEAVAKALSEREGKYSEFSILYNAYNLNIPITVHSAIGTEIIHQHPSADGAAIGDTTYTDFKIFCKTVSMLDKKSIVMNVGSAVIMPEVFLKALTVSRNLGYDTFGFTSATFDMVRHYRPLTNVVERPTQDKGKGYYFIGHHEIMLPLLFAFLKS